MNLMCPLEITNFRLLLSCGQPLARLGAKVLGVDTLPEGVAAAKDHANTTSPKQWAAFPHGAPEYRTMTMNDAAVQFPHEFDAVIASEMLEHVTNWREIVKDISVCLKVVLSKPMNTFVLPNL